MVLPILYTIIRNYAPIVTLPIAFVVGAVGYTLESRLRKDITPSFDSIEEKRRKREEELGKLPISPDPVPEYRAPKTILDTNLPPSLQTMGNK